VHAWVRQRMLPHLPSSLAKDFVIPAKAGIQGVHAAPDKPWAPASAGVTVCTPPPRGGGLHPASAAVTATAPETPGTLPA